MADDYVLMHKQNFGEWRTAVLALVKVLRSVGCILFISRLNLRQGVVAWEFR